MGIFFTLKLLYSKLIKKTDDFKDLYYMFVKRCQKKEVIC